MSLIFGKRGPAPVEPIDPSEDAEALRRRLALRGGEQSTLLAGRPATANVFKSDLGESRKPKTIDRFNVLDQATRLDELVKTPGTSRLNPGRGASALLTGRGASTRRNIFKSNLGGTARRLNQ